MSNHDHDDHGLAHVASLKVLFGVWGTLMFLTIVTVLATKIDLGHDFNLVVAMVIATIKAALVCGYFMHLKYDTKLYSIAFLAGLLFFILFVGMTMMDAGQYQDVIIWDENNPPDPL